MFNIRYLGALGCLFAADAYFSDYKYHDAMVLWGLVVIGMCMAGEAIVKARNANIRALAAESEALLHNNVNATTNSNLINLSDIAPQKPDISELAYHTKSIDSKTDISTVINDVSEEISVITHPSINNDDVVDSNYIGQNLSRTDVIDCSQ